MNIPYEWITGLRYTRARRNNHFISFISLISIGGVSLGVASLIVILSVMNGFEHELRQRLLGMVSHVTINSYDEPLLQWKKFAELASQNEHVIAAAPFISTEGMLRHGHQLGGTLIRGIDPEREKTVSEIDQHIIFGEYGALKAGAYGILLGSHLATSLGVSIGDQVDVMIPQMQVTPAGLLPRFRRFTVVSIFEFGMYEYDRTLSVVHMRDMQRLLRMDQAVSGVRLKLDDMFIAPVVRQQLNERIGTLAWVDDWSRQHGNFFRAIRTEKTAMFVILTLIVAVAAFNIVSTLVMAVNDKQSEIAILRTYGATPFSIMQIFIIQGLFIGVLGIGVGVISGVVCALNVETIVPWIEAMTNQNFMPGDVYSISEMPSRLVWKDVERIAIVAFLLSLFSTLYPAWYASHMSPVEALRHE